MTLDDRTANLSTPEQLADLAAVLASPTRLAVLTTLVRSKEALSINEVARRVGVDASPVRGHLETLARAGIAREVPAGRERRFTTALQDARVVLEGVRRTARVERGEPPKAVAKLLRKREGYAKDLAKIEAKARELDKAIEEAWEREGRGGKGEG